MAPLENLLPHLMHVLPTQIYREIARAYGIRVLTSSLALILSADTGIPSDWLNQPRCVFTRRAHQQAEKGGEA